MNEWSEFFTAAAGASASLAGLIFVGVSMSLKEILAIPRMPNRALGALLMLLSILVVSLLCLIPDQSFVWLGMELLVVALIIWFTVIYLDVDTLKNSKPEFRHYNVRNLIFNQLASLSYLAGAAATLVNGRDGLYCLAPAVIMSFYKGIIEGWILLVEIHRKP